MKTWWRIQFADTVSAIVYTLVRRNPVRSPHERVNRTVAFVLSQQRRMPSFLVLPLQALTLVFGLAGSGSFLRRFLSQSSDQRAAHLEVWRRSPIAACRDLHRFFESLIALAWLDPETCNTAPTKIAEPAAPAILEHRDCEVAVVGSGPGGAVAAALWAEAGANVTVFETGRNLPLESCRPFSVAEMVQKYRNGGLTPAFGSPKIAYAEGACVGGGSEINSGLYHRTPTRLLERWASEFSLEGASPAEMQPHFEVCEHDLSVSLLPGAAPKASLKLADGAAALGWQCQEVPRWFRYAGTDGAESLGARQSMTRTFLPRLLDAGGSLISDTAVVRLRRRRQRWSLETRSLGGQPKTFFAERVILAGGAIGTPALLRRSGLAPRAGRHLQMHPTIKVVALFNEEVSPPGMGVPVHQVKQFAPAYTLGCSISSQPHLALAMLDHPEHLHLVESHATRMAVYYAMIVPEGEGRVRTIIGTRDPFVSYALTDGDLRTLGSALQSLCKLLLAAGATTLFPSISGQMPIRATGDLSSLPVSIPRGTSSLMTIHLFSSCRMGEDPERCVTDSFGRVHHEDNLHISDASLLPSAPGVNPQGTIMALARRNALHHCGIDSRTSGAALTMQNRSLPTAA